MSPKSFLWAWRDFTRFRRLDESLRSIIFYAEDSSAWSHLGPLVEELTHRRGREVCYLTSNPADPVLDAEIPKLHQFYIGEGIIRTIVFVTLRAAVFVMTMPDLQNFFLKRSKHPVHYVYVFHSMVSTHMVYRLGAFDHYDTILCVGPQHEREIRANEAVYGLRAKRLVAHGYGRLDSIMAQREHEHEATLSTEGKVRVLVAPSWGPGGTLEIHGLDLVRHLLSAGYEVVLRPHPMTLKKWPNSVRSIEKAFSATPGFQLETNVASQQSFYSADLMISDWSGVALEYAFAFERPVLFVDVECKTRNPDYQRLAITPIEVDIREKIGIVVSPDDLDRLPEHIESLIVNGESYVQAIREQRSALVYNPGCSASVGAGYIDGLSDLSHVN